MTEQRNIKLVIQYMGHDFAGWQYQPSQRTVQGEMEKVLRKLTGRKTTLYAAGRTDAGVHALGQVANFRTLHRLPAKKYRDALNFYLPDDILVVSAEEVPDSFHSRYDAAFRRYRYLIGTSKSARYKGLRWEIESKINAAALAASAEIIWGEHDFSAFCVMSSRKENNNCIVFDSRWSGKEDMLIFDITANRFLHTMIRSLVGLMVDRARGAITAKMFKDIFHGGGRADLGRVAPAMGLYLVAVGY